jgi:formate-dependent nitrite reductase membrane component NrfD
MSWGSWVLVIIYLLSVLQIASTLRVGYPTLAGMLQRLPGVTPILDAAERYRRHIAAWCIPFGIALGIYTGILLSAFSARPFWNTSILGPLFLVSGLSAAAALGMMASSERSERHWLARADLVLIVVEIVLLALLLAGLATGGAAQLKALGLVTGGAFTVPFWVWFVALGLILPLLLELWELVGGRPIFLIAPVLVLIGGFMLRQVTLQVGQASNWSVYETQFDPTLLGRLTDRQAPE